jgi:tryptophanyl-tRNA synthetase
MSLQDGTSKMSKSAENDNSRINILDPPELIVKKIKKCKTDLFTGLEWDNSDRSECTNLLNMYQAVTGRNREEILTEVSEMSWGTFKPILADAVVAHLEPIQKKYREVKEDEVYLNKILADGSESADLVAEQTLKWAKESMGFHLRP